VRIATFAYAPSFFEAKRSSPLSINETLFANSVECEKVFAECLLFANVSSKAFSERETESIDIDAFTLRFHIYFTNLREGERRHVALLHAIIIHTLA